MKEKKNSRQRREKAIRKCTATRFGGRPSGVRDETSANDVLIDRLPRRGPFSCISLPAGEMQRLGAPRRLYWGVQAGMISNSSSRVVGGERARTEPEMGQLGSTSAFFVFVHKPGIDAHGIGSLPDSTTERLDGGGNPMRSAGTWVTPAPIARRAHATQRNQPARRHAAGSSV